jgi:hypothetical protein
MMAPKGIDNTPSTTEMAHWAELRGVVENVFPPMKTNKIWTPIMIRLIVIKSQLRHNPSKILNLLSSRR